MIQKPKKGAGLGYFIILLLILIVFAAAGVFVSRRFAPSKARADLQEYYHLTARESIDRAAAGNDELAIIIDNEILDQEEEEKTIFRARKYDDGVYVPISLVRDHVDPRFYLDRYEGLVIFTDAEGSTIANVGSSTYTYNGVEENAGYVIARDIGGEVFLNMEFVAAHSTATYLVLTDPARVYIRNQRGQIEYANAKSDTRIRTSASKKASIVADVKKGAKLQVLDLEDDWTRVIDQEGYIGYVQNNLLGDSYEEAAASDHTEPEYTHITLDEPINMVWHGIYYYESNQYIADYTANMTGVNVLAPTWFLFSDMYGDILSYASQDYVDYAHENGWYVWAVLEDLDGESSVDILPYTSRRHAAISQMIGECLTYGIDGINLDLELVTASEGNDFIQFVRELSVECRKNQIVLSCSDYTPYNYNAYRHTDEQSKICDYVAVMAYDDYVGGSEAGPNAGLPFVEESLSVCAGVVDMSRLIVGIPFYTRLWFEYSDGTLGRDTCDMNTVEELTAEHELTYHWLEDVGYDYAEYEETTEAYGEYNELGEYVEVPEKTTKTRIWYENAKSLDAKLKLISQYNVAGIASWRLGQETQDVWAVLEKYY